MDKDKIEKFLQKVQNIKLKTSINMADDNIFSILQIEHKERFHCRFLHYLIKTHWREFEEYFSYKFRLPNENIAFSCCEYSCGSMQGCEKAVDGYVDIFFQMESNKILAFEVKLYADDQPEQLLRYRYCLKQQFGVDPVLIYLTLDGKMPSPESTSCEVCKHKQYGVCPQYQPLGKNDYIMLSFREIVGWIKTLENSFVQTGNISASAGLILQYKIILEREINMQEVVSKILNEKENFNAAEAIEDSIESARKQIQNQFFMGLEDLAKSRLKDNFIQADEMYLKLDEGNAKFAFKKNDGSEKFFIVSCGTNIYCYRGHGDQLEKNQWSYITSKWFDGVIENAGTQNVKEAINGKKPSSKNKIVEWYFADEQKQTRELENIIKNVVNYCEAIDNIKS